MATPKELTRLAAFTLEDYLNKGTMTSMVMASTPLLSWAEKGGCFDKAVGSKKFRTQITVARNDSFKGFKPYETLTYPQFGGYEFAEWVMKEHYSSASISEQEVTYNAGIMKMADVVKHVIDTTRRDAANAINTTLIQSTGDEVTAAGLRLLVTDALSPTGTTVGGINAATNPWWQALIKRPGSTMPRLDWKRPMIAWTYGTDANTVPSPYDAVADTSNWQPLTLGLLEDMTVDLGRGPAGKPVACATTLDIIKSIITLLKAEGLAMGTGWVSTNGSKIMGDGFDTVEYMGVSYFFDDEVEAGAMYFLNPAGFKVRVEPSHWMQSDGWKEPYDQKAQYMDIQMWFQTYSPDRRCLGKAEQVAHIV